MAGADSLIPDPTGGVKTTVTVLQSAPLSAQSLSALETNVARKLEGLKQQGGFSLLDNLQKVELVPVRNGLKKLAHLAQSMSEAMQSRHLAASVSVEPLADKVIVQTPGSSEAVKAMLRELKFPDVTYLVVSAPVHFVKPPSSGTTTSPADPNRLSNTTQLSSGLYIATAQFDCTYGFTGVNSSGQKVGVTARHCFNASNADKSVRHPLNGNVLGTAQLGSNTSGTDVAVISLGSTLQAQSVSATSRTIAIPASVTDDTIVNRLPITGIASGLSLPAEIDFTGQKSFIRKWVKGVDYGEVKLVQNTNIPTSAGFTVTGPQECARMLHDTTGNTIGQRWQEGDSGGPVYTPDGKMLGIASNYRGIQYVTSVGGSISVSFQPYICYVPMGTIASEFSVNVATN